MLNRYKGVKSPELSMNTTENWLENLRIISAQALLSTNKYIYIFFSFMYVIKYKVYKGIVVVVGSDFY